MIQKITLCAVLLGIFAIAGNAQNNQTDSQTQKEVRTRANRATQQSTQSNEQLAQPKRVEDSLRVHLQKPGGKGEDLPYSGEQGRDRTGN
ncbi:MAG: hypothetical protein ABI891_09110 [Acidobacteriota bacterium]